MLRRRSVVDGIDRDEQKKAVAEMLTKSYVVSMAHIEWTSKALRQLKSLAVRDRASIHAAVGELAHWPQCRGVKALTARAGYRLRVGRYRVLFLVIDETPRVIKVQEVKKRDEHTY